MIVTERPGRRLAAALLLGVLLGGCAREPQPAPTPPAEVAAFTLRPEPVTLVRELPGRVRPYLIAEVRPQVDGIVQSRLFEEGRAVEAGQPLYQLDDARYRAELASAQATLARAQATLHAARLDAERAEELVARQVISRNDHEDVIARLRQAEADVMAAEAAVRSAEIRVADARIAAPIGGRIGKSSVTPGALVTANQPNPLATVQQLDPVYVDLTWSSRELLELRRELALGNLARADDVPVTILLEDGSRYEHAGTMRFADLTVDPGTGSISLRVEVPNPDHLLLPGMYVRALVSNAERRHALLVPQQSITRDARGRAFAMVVADDGAVQRRLVEVSRAVGQRWLVESGLEAGERVVVEGLQNLKPGVPVQVAEWREPGPLELGRADVARSR
ncbi:MAG TPA: efflux RND transporter periplasmic adaptor subunit [Pseudomonadales bacterium]